MERPTEQTVFSLSDAVPEPLDFASVALAPDADERVLARGAVGELCSVRKLSRRGAVLHTDTPVAVGQHLRFELMNGRTIAGNVSWVRGSEVILRFAEDLDVLGVIAAELVSQQGERRRMPRVELEAPVKLTMGPRVINAVTVDVSQGGLKATMREELEPGTALDVQLPGFRALPSHVRWCEGGRVGLLFDDALSWQEMMPWMRARSVPAAARRTLTPAVGGPERAPAPEPSSVELNIPARIRDRSERWDVAVMAITTTGVEFTSYTRPRFGSLISVSLPGLPGWPGRVVSSEGDRWTCEFDQPLHPAVLDRMLAGRR
jgi:hypothetical protein